METEIVEATNLYGEEKSLYEVEKRFLTWEDRKQQVKNDKHELVYCLFENVRTFNHGQGLVATWGSITKSSWEKCRRVIRKIEELTLEQKIEGAKMIAEKSAVNQWAKKNY